MDADAGAHHLLAAADAAEAAGDEDGAIAALRSLFDDLGWLNAIARGAAHSLGADPFHLFGLTAMTSGALQQLLFASGARASVTLCTLQRPVDAVAPRNIAPASHAFVGNRSLLRLLSDEPLDGRLAILSERCIDRPIRVMPGRIFDMDERRRVLWIDPPERLALFLRARVRRLPAPIVATYKVGADRPHNLANGDDGLARSLAMIAMLRVLDTPPPLDALRALLPRAHGAQRWALMREMLALDTMTSWPDLCAMARDEPDPAVRGAATSLVARFTPDQQPQQASQPCPV